MTTDTKIEWTCDFCCKKQAEANRVWPQGWRRWAVREITGFEGGVSTDLDMCGSCLANLDPGQAPVRLRASFVRYLAGRFKQLRSGLPLRPL